MTAKSRNRPKTTASKLAYWIATWFGCGLSPVAPGTVGAAGGLLVAWLAGGSGRRATETIVALTLATLAPGIWAAGRAARDRKAKDPGFVVVDEVLGVWVALLGATAHNGMSWLGAFVLFRVFDIWKPPPVRQLERLPGGWGIVADDLAAGLWAAVLLRAAGWIGLY
jgi:phosphatidylglycerophosphatase A